MVTEVRVRETDKNQAGTGSASASANRAGACAVGGVSEKALGKRPVGVSWLSPWRR